MKTGNTNRQLIVITGPTASGKTALAIRVAKAAGTEIISADSRQCFKELNIAVARPSAAELAAVPHHFIASHSIHSEVTAATFAEYASAILEKLFENHTTVVLAGGTGLYIRALLEGLDQIPEVPAAVRQQVITGYRDNGIGWLQDQLRQLDPDFYREGEILNPQRMMRALEVRLATGKSVLAYRTGEKKINPFSVIKLGIAIPRERLLKQISQRVNNMREQGLVEEARSLYAYRHLNALQTVGYTELFDYFDGKISLDEALVQIGIHTRQYAKRQLTWFRRDPDIHWIDPAEQESLSKLANLTGSGFL